MAEVRPGLHVGGWEELQRGAGRWTHVLSLDGVEEVDGTASSSGGGDSVGRRPKRMAVSVLDLASESILCHFDRCIDFIHGAMADRDSDPAMALLVHCQAGCSRSVSVVAAWLMRTEGLTYDQALSAIREVRPMAEPNEGFDQQLRLFEAMGCKTQFSDRRYRHHLLMHNTEEWFRIRRGLDEDSDALGFSRCSVEDDVASDPPIKCRKCNAILAKASQVITHAPPSHAKYAGNNKKWKKDGRVASGTCSSLFVEPIKWMQPAIDAGTNEGKLFCYNCNAKIGSFSWSGSQCSCSAWITPAFQIHSSKVDRTPAHAAGAR